MEEVRACSFIFFFFGGGVYLFLVFLWVFLHQKSNKKMAFLTPDFEIMYFSNLPSDLLFQEYSEKHYFKFLPKHRGFFYQ